MGENVLGFGLGLIYGRRLAIIEPVFGNIRSNKKLVRLTYRGLGKVSVQWRLYFLVHNIEKLAHYGSKYGHTRLVRVLPAFKKPLPRSDGAFIRLFAATNTYFDIKPAAEKTWS